MRNFIPYGRQNIDQDDIDSVVEVLRSSFVTQGPRVEEFEARVAEYCGAGFAVAFNSGTSALHAAMFAAGVRTGDEVISSPVTFAATTNSALYLGACPVFVDMNPTSYCIDVDKIEAAITNKTRVIVPVDYAGYPVDIKRIKDVAGKHRLVVIEDAAHALGAVREDAPVGREADMTMFSFHPVKHITTGEGGIIVGNDAKFYRKLKLFRSHGIVKDRELCEAAHGPWYYEMQELGYNFRITDFQCALGLSQFKKLPTFLRERARIAGVYDESFKDMELITIPSQPPGKSQHAYHLYPLLLAASIDRRALFEHLQACKIGVQIHYIPVHLHPYYRRNFGYQPGDFPAAEDFYAREISLPIFPGLGADDQQYVINSVIEGINQQT